MSDAGVVTHVRVFIDRATVTRARTVTLGPGPQTVTFTGLPRPMEQDTLRALAKAADANLQIVSVTAKTAFAEPSSARRAEVEKELDALEAKLRATEDAQGSDSHAADLLTQYAQLASEHMSLEWLDGDPSFDRWNEALDQLRGSHARLAGTGAARAEEIERLLRRTRELEAEQDRIGTRTSIGVDVTVTLQGPEDGEAQVELELSYVTRAAQWMPAYDARLDETGESPKVQWTAVALVKQTTGEDWSDVSLVATTMRPPLSEPPPELQKVSISGYAGGPDSDVVVRTDAGPRLGGGGGGPPAPAAQVELEAPGAVSVPSTNRPVRVELFDAELAVTRRLEVAPLQRPVATWVLQLHNTTGRVLLPGAVSLFRGPNYSGRAEVGFVAGAERFSLPLATEGGLRIRREAHARPPKRTAVTGTQTFEYLTETEVENVGPETVELWVRDRVPVSRSERIGVELLKFPKEADLHAETGQFEIRLQVAAGKQEKLQIGYRITAPKGMHLSPPGQL